MNYRQEIRPFEQVSKKILRVKPTETEAFITAALALRGDIEKIGPWDPSHKTILPTRVGGPLHQELAKAFTREERFPLTSRGAEVERTAREIAILLYRSDALVEGSKALRSLVTEWQNLLRYLESYSKVLASFLKDFKPAPTSFQWRGLWFENPNLWEERDVKKLLDELEWLFDKFKRRGIEKTLLTSLSHVKLLRGDSEFTDSTGVRRNEAGHYNIPGKFIAFRHSTVSAQTGRFLQKWLAEVFLHELGHHVHLNLLPTQAKKFWDSGWTLVDEERAQAEKNLRVRVRDQERFFNLFEKAKWDLNAVGRKLKGVDRLKLISWLYQRKWITGVKQIRIHPQVKERIQNLQDPWPAFEAKNWGYTGAEAQQKFEQYKKDLVYLAKRDLAFGSPFDISEEMIDQFRKELPDQAIKDLGIPSEYGRTDVREDFAETFVLFVLQPDRLSDVARWRMGRTLGMSSSLGKPMMKMTRMAMLVAKTYVNRQQSFDSPTYPDTLTRLV